MNKIIKRIIASVLVACALVGVFFLGYFFKDITMDSELREVYQFLQTYKKHYLYDEEGNLVKDISNVILDEYSQYYTKEEYERVDAEGYGNMTDIGLIFKGNSLNIKKVAGNSPSKLAGIKVGGVLVEMDTGSGFTTLSSYTDFSLKIEAVKENAYVGLKIDYDGEVKTYSVQKRDYKRTYVEYADSQGVYAFSDKDGKMALYKTEEESFIEDNAIGYIKYDKFYGRDSGLLGSAGQITEVLNKFKNDGKSKVIVDLRGNGGGYIDILCNIARHFIDGDKSGNNLILYGKDKNDRRIEYYSKSSLYDNYNFEKIIVLADESSASASECFIGAVLDYDKTDKVTVLISSSTSGGKTVYKTYGKGIMQTTYKHIDGSAVKLTVAQIYWPISNTTIHKIGVIGQDSGKILAVDKENALQKALEI